MEVVRKLHVTFNIGLSENRKDNELPYWTLYGRVKTGNSFWVVTH